MTKPKPLKRIMWGVFSAHGFLQWHDRDTPLIYERRKDADGTTLNNEVVASALVAVRPVAARKRVKP